MRKWAELNVLGCKGEKNPTHKAKGTQGTIKKEMEYQNNKRVKNN